jgi:medium-chain acyl-[acyl-carrier-protein] hydrolase
MKEYIIRRNFLITSADVDFEGVLRISSLTNFLIQSAWQHAEILGWGVNDLMKKNLAWVLSGFKIELLSYPVWKQTITVETWPKGINRLFYLRDFNISDEQGNVFAKATSNWLLIDIDKRRPKLIEIDNEVFHMNPDRHAIKDFVPVLNFTGEAESTTPYQVRYSNVDINQHLTTTGYLDFVFDTYNPDFISKSRPKTVIANFIKEVKFGAQINMLRNKLSESQHLFQLEASDSTNAYFRAELTY